MFWKTKEECAIYAIVFLSAGFLITVPELQYSDGFAGQLFFLIAGINLLFLIFKSIYIPEITKKDSTQWILNDSEVKWGNALYGLFFISVAFILVEKEDRTFNSLAFLLAILFGLSEIVMFLVRPLLMACAKFVKT